MKPLVVLASIFAAASADGFGLGGGSGGYSVGGQQRNGFAGNGVVGGNGGGYSNAGGFGGGHNNFAPAGGYSGGGGGGFGNGFNNNGIGGNFQNNDGGNFGGGGGGQIRKFVSVHVGPEEPQFTQTKVIRAGGPPDKHVNIIFVKAPSASSAQNTEVILPEAPQQKTLVYVLVKKQESTSNVRVRGPAPTRPSKPEVYFIRYKDGSGPAPVAPGTAVPGFNNVIGGGGAIPNVAPGPAYGVPGPHSGGVPAPNGGY